MPRHKKFVETPEQKRRIREEERRGRELARTYNKVRREMEKERWRQEKKNPAWRVTRLAGERGIRRGPLGQMMKELGYSREGAFKVLYRTRLNEGYSWKQAKAGAEREIEKYYGKK